MKKYSKPTIKVRALDMEGLLAASGLIDQTDGTKTQSTNESFTTIETSDAIESKRNLFDSRWDGE